MKSKSRLGMPVSDGVSSATADKLEVYLEVKLFKSAGLGTLKSEREMCSSFKKEPLHFKELYDFIFCLIALLASHARNNEFNNFLKI